MARWRWKLRRLAGLDSARRVLLIEAAALLLLARLALLLLPFPWLARRLGTFVPPTDSRVALGGSESAQEHRLLAHEVGWAVTRAARHVPFTAVCLPQAMAAQFMLRRRHVATVMHFGVAKGIATPLSAHAWLYAAGVEVTGFPVAEGFTKIGCFV